MKTTPKRVKLNKLNENILQTNIKTPKEEKTAITKTSEVKVKQKAIKRESEDGDPEIKKKRRRRSKTGKQKKLNISRSSSRSKLPKVKNLDYKKVRKVVDGLLSLVEKKRNDGNNQLFKDEVQKIMLQVNSIKKAFCPTRLLRFSLPYPLYNDLSEICLLVPDKKQVKKDIEKTVEYYTQLLEENKVTSINKVLPMRAISTEYTQYEMRRKLANQFDVFLADGRISHFVTKRLGRWFAYTAKTPIPMNLNGKDWKGTIEKALAKTQMSIRSSSDSSSVTVGNTSQSAKKITSNIEAVCNGLAKEFPGSWPNVRSLLLKTKDVPSLPVYMSSVSPNEIQVPVMKSTRAPRDDEVEGELTTMLDTTVRVKSDGTVIVHKPKRKATTELSDAEDEEILKEALKNQKRTKTVREDEDENDDEERIIKKMERKVLEKFAAGKDNSSENDEDDTEKKQVDKKQPKGVEIKSLKKANLKKSKHLEKVAKTNWIKSTKKGVKRLSKDQRKAKIKVKKAEKNKR